MDSEAADPDLSRRPDPPGLSGPADLAGSELHELRRSYHDRIADLRSTTIALVNDAALTVGDATSALLSGNTDRGLAVAESAATAPARVAEVETEVLSLLALQAPVARDLRVILAARDIAHEAELCLGLCHALATRVDKIEPILTPELRDLFESVGRETSGLLSRANGAWTTLDPDQAAAVTEAAAESRHVQQQLFAEIVGLRLVPADAAVDLGMAVRIFERLTDHALDIARRVAFAVSGTAA